jgi:hypothetical protein
MCLRLPRGTSPTVPIMVSLQPPRSVQARRQTRPVRPLSRLLLRQCPQLQQEAQVAPKAQARLRKQRDTTIGKSACSYVDDHG